MSRTIERDTRSPVTARIWGRTRKALESLGKDEKFAHTTLIGDTAEILAGAIHCSRCGEPVPVAMGDCTGRPLRAWVADATTAVCRQKCKDHQPVLVGAETGSQPQASSGTAGEAATREEDAQGRTEPPAPVPAQPRKKRAAANEGAVVAAEVDRVLEQMDVSFAAADPVPAATVRQLRDTVPGVVTASELTGPAPVFRAGPEIDCLHENFRGVKGVCPDCKQWVKP